MALFSAAAEAGHPFPSIPSTNRCAPSTSMAVRWGFAMDSGHDSTGFSRETLGGSMWGPPVMERWFSFTP